MIEVRQTEIFAHWLAGLRDSRAPARINARIRRLSIGNPGDTRSVGGGVSEMRIDFGPGYRVYYTRRGEALVTLLAGGDKRTQDRMSKVNRKSKSKTTTWDAASYLKTDEDIAHYLEAAFEDGDPSLVAAALGDVARAKGMAEIAHAAGLGRESLYKALSREGNPEFATILRVIHALGLKLRIAV